MQVQNRRVAKDTLQFMLEVRRPPGILYEQWDQRLMADVGINQVLPRSFLYPGTFVCTWLCGPDSPSFLHLHLTSDVATPFRCSKSYRSRTNVIYKRLWVPYPIVSVGLWRMVLHCCCFGADACAPRRGQGHMEVGTRQYLCPWLHGCILCMCEHYVS